jgi:GNAT superfamily N-acetyltransferase
MIEKLSKTLETITGSSGEKSFKPEDVTVERSVFVVAYNDELEAVGCGAIRQIDDTTAEVKRMFAKTKGDGVGTEILNYLENKAKGLGYSALRLETRLINKRAVAFYEKRGYSCIPNYGKYVNRPEAVCFEKVIIKL